MPKRHDRHEEWAIVQLTQIVELSDRERDALPGSVVRLVKQARKIMIRRRDPYRGVRREN